MPADTPVDELVDQSSIIFLGTVQKLGASTVSSYTPTSHTIMARVDRVLRAPASLGDLTGQRITVELTQAPGLRPGQQAIFYTNGLVYGESLVVQEVARREAPPHALARQAEVSQTVASVKTAQDRHLQLRIESADSVVTGKVIAVRKPPRVPGVPLSEHDPDWREATIEVEHVENGPPIKQLTVFFPASDDVRWRDAPKFSVGQEGVWILHRHQARELRTPGYTALQPSDFQPKAQRTRVRSLIQRPK